MCGLFTAKQPSSGDEGRRLGILHLGWHAHEQRMPDRTQRATQSTNANADLIQRVSLQLGNDVSVKKAFLCSSRTSYIGKAKGEGSNFCGYRNIQMLISQLLPTRPKDAVKFESSIPNIFRLQDLIEAAWDRGINAQGREQTGGIRGTRKHIGTQEAQALFRSLEIKTAVNSFQDSKSSQAWRELLEYSWTHFSMSTAAAEGNEDKVVQTDLPPIYLQRPRHSMTIVGIELRKDGTRQLLVFDPGVDMGSMRDSRLMKACRKGKRQLLPFRAFEILMLDGN